MRTSPSVPAVLAAALLFAVVGCSSPAPSGGDADGPAVSSAPADTDTGTDAQEDSDAGADADGVCALVPAAELATAIGNDPGAGVDGAENGLTNCTWSIDGTPAVIAQVGDAATFFPADLYPKPEGASDVDGGWASAEARSIFIVKGSTGFLLNAFLFGVEAGDEGAWAALGAAISANL